MMPRTLGLDIGSNSIGWALVDEGAGAILGMGARVFPEGVDRDKQGGEVSKNETRRGARAMRRQVARRARRKAILRRALVEAGLFPADREEQRKLDGLDPYALRERALVERLAPREIGRVFLHLAQRRGFLSNRKTDRDKDGDKKPSEILAEMNDLQAAMGDRKLGQHFAASLEDDRHRRVRGIHTRRSMYLDEFEAIWESQRAHHPDLLTDALKYGVKGPRTYPIEPRPIPHRKTNTELAEHGLHGLLFFQRALYWPKSVVGRCELEKGQPRCPRADRAAQRFRMLQEVNNLRITDGRGQVRPLSDKERADLIAWLSTKETAKFEEIRKRLKLADDAGLNLERGERPKMHGLPTDATLAGKHLFHKAWAKKTEVEKDAIVRCLIEETDEDEIRRKAVADWGCSEEVAGRLARLNLEPGYASFSREAITKLLPHLERGLRLMANDATDSAMHAAGYLRPDQRDPDPLDRLPPPPGDIRNPLVKQALHEVRRLVNAILDEYGKPDAIHVELAREVQGGLRARREYTERMRAREKVREQAAEFVRSLGSKVGRDAIERVLLWREQGETCLYSGRPISPEQLLGGEVQVDHILPYSRSLDNSMANKAVCFRDENDAKGNRTPADWLKGLNPEKYEAVLQRAARLPREVRDGKRRKIAAESIEIDFIERQLRDTAYITRVVQQYVRRLGVDVVCVKGQTTAELRHVWGLDGVLRDDGLKLKNREDHRHHAVDALVIALTTRSHLQNLAKLRFLKRERPDVAFTREAADRVFPRPWDSFDLDARRVVDGIYVSFRINRRVRGKLHEDTLYGRTSQPEKATGGPRPHAKGWLEEEGVYVLRKNLVDLSGNEVGKIRDARTKELVLERLRDSDIDPDDLGANKPKKKVWEEPLYMVARGATPTKDTPRIVRVRITKDDKTIRPIRSGERTAYVKTGNNHHIELFETLAEPGGKPKRLHHSVSLLEAAERVRRGEPAVQKAHPERPEAIFLLALHPGDMVYGTIGKSEGLFRLTTFSGTSGQMWFVSHRDARRSGDRKEESAKPNTFRARKVTVDVLGRLWFDRREDRPTGL